MKEFEEIKVEGTPYKIGEVVQALQMIQEICQKSGEGCDCCPLF